MALRSLGRPARLRWPLDDTSAAASPGGDDHRERDADHGSGLGLVGPGPAAGGRLRRHGRHDGPAGGGPGAAAIGARRHGPRLIFISNGNSDWWTAVETGMRDGAAKFGARVELRRNTEGSPEGQIRAPGGRAEPRRRQGGGHLGPGGRVARHRRQDARPPEGRQGRHRDRLGRRRPTPAAPTSARTTARRARSPARPPGRSGRRGARRSSSSALAAAANAQRAERGLLRRRRQGVHQARTVRGQERHGPGPGQRRDGDHQVSRRGRLPRPLVVQRRADRAGGQPVPRPPQEGDRRHVRPRRGGRRPHRAGPHRRVRLPEPLRDGLPGRPPAQGVHRGRQGDDLRDAPRRRRRRSTRGSG